MSRVEKEPSASLSWDEVLAWRLERQHLAVRRPRAEFLRVAGDICGLHAQVMSSAELTLWARVEGLEPDDVRRALWEERSLVKTWAMRGTLHLLPSAELPLWVAAHGVLKPRHHSAAWQKYFGMSGEEMDEALAEISTALGGGYPLTREELAGEVGRITGSDELAGKMLESWGAMLKPAAHRGELCFGPNAGRRVRFVRPDLWLEAWETRDTDESIKEVVRRYLSAYGPASREEFARWFGASLAQAGRQIEGLGEEVVRVEVEGSGAWMLAEDVPRALGTEPGGVVRLLPAFDQYVVTAPRGNEKVLPESLKKRVYRAQGWLSPVLLVDGRIEGVWRHERKGDRLTVRIEPFTEQPARVRDEVEGEVHRLALFIGGEPEIAWAEPGG